MKTFKQYRSEKDSWIQSKRREFWNAMDEKKKREDDIARDEKNAYDKKKKRKVTVDWK